MNHHESASIKRDQYFALPVQVWEHFNESEDMEVWLARTVRELLVDSERTRGSVKRSRATQI